MSTMTAREALEKAALICEERADDDCAFAIRTLAASLPSDAPVSETATKGCKEKNGEGLTPRTDALFPVGPLGVPETGKNITELRDEFCKLEQELAAANRRAEYWKAEHLAGNALIENLQSASGARPTEAMCEAVRGITQLLRGKPGCTFGDLMLHCESRGDDLALWPQWARDSEGYVTESAAACLIYEVMARVRWQPEGGERWITNRSIQPTALCATCSL